MLRPGWVIAALMTVTTGIALLMSASSLLHTLELRLEPLLEYTRVPAAATGSDVPNTRQQPDMARELEPNLNEEHSGPPVERQLLPNRAIISDAYDNVDTADQPGTASSVWAGARSLESARMQGVCGGMPGHWLPSSALPSLSVAPLEDAEATEEEIPLRRARHLHGYRGLSGGVDSGGSDPWFRRRLKGHTVMGAGCGKSKEYKVPHEHDGAGPRVQKRPKPSEGPLIQCIRDIKKCGEAAKRAARSLPGVKILLSKQGQLRVNGLEPMYDNCALVGNAGHLSKRRFGEYIDSHQLVVRFNVQKTFEFSAYVGNKTTLRVVNHRRSLAMCCRGNWPEAKAGIKSSGMMIWFPAAQQDIMTACQKRYPDNPRMVLPSSVIRTEVQAMVVMRKDLQRIGFGPFGAWRQMTSGSHAALLFSTMCKSVSLFGFTTYGGNSEGGADQYAAAIMKQEQGAKNTKLGATAKARSGEKWHDWKGEKFVLRLLNAAGLINICSM